MHCGFIHFEASSSPHRCSSSAIPKKAFWVDSTVAPSASAGAADTGSPRRRSPRHTLPLRTHPRHLYTTTDAIDNSLSTKGIEFVIAYCRPFGSCLKGCLAAAEPEDSVWLVRVLLSQYGAGKGSFHAWDS
jgi:hypothetical protein